MRIYHDLSLTCVSPTFGQVHNGRLVIKLDWYTGDKDALKGGLVNSPSEMEWSEMNVCSCKEKVKELVGVERQRVREAEGQANGVSQVKEWHKKEST